MSTPAANIALIDDTFSDENIRRSLKDYVMCLDMAEAAISKAAPKEQVLDAMATALFQHMTNPFSVIMTPMVRPIILEIFREGGREFGNRFLIRTIPLVKTIENGANVRDYGSVYKDIDRRIE